MENANQKKNHSEELKISPLGTEEINSVIKSFKNSSFNQEELYRKDKKNFVKKSLFDLAKESERVSPNENQNDTDISRKENDPETNVDLNQEIINAIICGCSSKINSAIDLASNHSNISIAFTLS